MKKTELLSPAGDWASLRAAIKAGADAVYFGIKSMNMRQAAQNFNIKTLNQVITYCHKNKVKAYLVINIIVYDNELHKIELIIKEAKKAKVDAIICWDFAVIQLCKKYKIDIFLSTQASVANKEAVLFYKKIGIRRIILARELSLKQIKDIIKKAKIEIEIFIHGALCYSISGRCFFSQELYKKSANRGECFQPCRRQYKLTDLKTGKEIETRINHFLSTKDLCTLPFIDKLIKSRITSFKIEGRNRSPEYVYTVTKVYRQAIDSYYNGTLKNNIHKLQKELESVYNRKFSHGFYFGMPTADDITDIQNSAATEKRVELGKIINYFKKSRVAVINLTSSDLNLGDIILIIGSKTGLVKTKVNSMEINHEKVDLAKKGQLIAIFLEENVRENDLVYKIITVK